MKSENRKKFEHKSILVMSQVLILVGLIFFTLCATNRMIVPAIFWAIVVAISMDRMVLEVQILAIKYSYKMFPFWIRLLSVSTQKTIFANVKEKYKPAKKLKKGKIFNTFVNILFFISAAIVVSTMIRLVPMVYVILIVVTQQIAPESTVAVAKLVALNLTIFMVALILLFSTSLIKVFRKSKEAKNVKK